MKLTTKESWQDATRLKMIEKSAFYQNQQVYQYGFYDAWQMQNDKIERAIEMLYNGAEKKSIIEILLSPLPLNTAE